MDLVIEIEVQEGLLLVTASGTLTFDAALRLLKQVCDTAAEKQINKILVTVSRWTESFLRLRGISSE